MKITLETNEIIYLRNDCDLCVISDILIPKISPHGDGNIKVEPQPTPKMR